MALVSPPATAEPLRCCLHPKIWGWDPFPQQFGMLCCVQALLAVPILAVPQAGCPHPSVCQARLRPSVCPAVSRPGRFLSPRVCVSLLSVCRPRPGCFRPHTSVCASPRHSCPSVLAFPVRVSFRASPPAVPGLGLALLGLVHLSLSCLSWCPVLCHLPLCPSWCLAGAGCPLPMAG